SGSRMSMRPLRRRLPRERRQRASPKTNHTVIGTPESSIRTASRGGSAPPSSDPDPAERRGLGPAIQRFHIDDLKPPSLHLDGPCVFKCLDRPPDRFAPLNRAT